MPGEERFIVVLMVDMRDSTRIAETRLPFDSVFIVDRFVTAAGLAVDAHGGRVSHFPGDGLVATFDLECGPGEACRQALATLTRIGHNIAELNAVMRAEVGEEIRFGIGAHCRSAIVGGIGYGPIRTFTTLGDAANVASRLETLCETFVCEAVISHDICRIADIATNSLPMEKARIRGRTAPIQVHPISRVRGLADLIAISEGVGQFARPHSV